MTDKRNKSRKWVGVYNEEIDRRIDRIFADRKDKRKKESKWIREKPTVDGYYWYKIIGVSSEHAKVLMKVEQQCLVMHYFGVKHKVGVYQLENLPSLYEYSLIKPPTDESNDPTKEDERKIKRFNELLQKFNTIGLTNPEKSELLSLNTFMLDVTSYHSLVFEKIKQSVLNEGKQKDK